MTEQTNIYDHFIFAHPNQKKKDKCNLPITPLPKENPMPILPHTLPYQIVKKMKKCRHDIFAVARYIFSCAMSRKNRRTVLDKGNSLINTFNRNKSGMFMIPKSIQSAKFK